VRCIHRSHSKIRGRFTEFTRCIASLLLIDLQQKVVQQSNKTASTHFQNHTVDNLEVSKEGEYIMGSVAELVSAMAALGILRAWNACEEERICAFPPATPTQARAIDPTAYARSHARCGNGNFGPSLR
jgi:hypothetical protein